MTEAVIFAVCAIGAALIMYGRYMAASSSSVIDDAEVDLVMRGTCKHCGEEIHRSSYGLFTHANGMYSCQSCKTVAEL